MHERFEQFEAIGSGPVGVVYRGRCVETGRPVVIKVLHPAALGIGRERDARWGRLILPAGDEPPTHPGLLGPIDVDPSRGWIIREDLPDEMPRRSGLSPDIATGVLVQSLRALLHLHEVLGRLHGSVQPRNVRVDGGGHVRLVDARGIPLDSGDRVEIPWLDLERHLPDEDTDQVADRDRDWLIRRPPSKYRAPELFDEESGPVAPASDLYGLGMVCYELLVGRRIDAIIPGASGEALRPPDAWSRWHREADRSLPPVRDLRPEVPEPLAGVVDRLVAKPLSWRFASAAEALDELGPHPRPVRIRFAGRSSQTGPAGPPGPEGSVPSPSRGGVAVMAAPAVRSVGGRVPIRRRTAEPAGFQEVTTDLGRRGWAAFRADRRLQALSGVLLGLLTLGTILANLGERRYDVMLVGQPMQMEVALVRLPDEDGGIPETITERGRLEPTAGGDASAVFRRLQPGSYLFVARARGHEQGRLQFDVGPEEPRFRSIRLDPRTRPVRFLFDPPIDPATARIRSAGRDRRVGELELPVEVDVPVEISVPGFSTARRTLRVPDSDRPGQEHVEAISLVRAPVTPIKVIVEVEPVMTGPEILVDGEPRGTVFEWKPGSGFSMVVSGTGYRAVRRMVQVPGDQDGPLRIPVTLPPDAAYRQVLLRAHPARVTASVLAEDRPETPIQPGVPRDFEVGTRLALSYRVDGLRYTTIDLVVEAGEGPQVVRIDEGDLGEIASRTLPLRLVRLDRQDPARPFFGGLERGVLEAMLDREADRAAVAGRAAANGRDPMPPPRSLLPGLEALQARRFASRWREGQSGLRSLMAPSSGELAGDVFFSRVPVTWQLWERVLGEDALPGEIRGDLGRRGDHPAVGIPREQALAFCRALTGRLRSEGTIDGTWEATPPRPIEVTFAEKAGVSGVPWGEEAGLAAGDEGEATREAALRNDGVVRRNIRAYAGGNRNRATVYRGEPNDLGIILGQVGTWAIGHAPDGWGTVAGPSFRDRPELLDSASWPLLWWTPDQFGLPDAERFAFHLDDGWAPGKTSRLREASVKSHVGLYVVLRRSPGQDGPIARRDAGTDR